MEAYYEKIEALKLPVPDENLIKAVIDAARARGILEGIEKMKKIHEENR